jgi:hypothetical protein
MPMTGEESAYRATQLSGYLYRLRILENQAERQCNVRLMELLRDVDFWSEMKVKPSKTTAETQLRTEQVWKKFLDIQALRIGVEETIRSLRTLVREYEKERKEFT